MRVTVTVFGFEVLALKLDRPQPRGQPEPAPVDPPGAQQSAATGPDKFGFYGGHGGTQERAWHPPARRPIGPNR